MSDENNGDGFSRRRGARVNNPSGLQRKELWRFWHAWLWMPSSEWRYIGDDHGFLSVYPVSQLKDSPERSGRNGLISPYSVHLPIPPTTFISFDDFSVKGYDKSVG
jgi:hypothetical protein